MTTPYPHPGNLPPLPVDDPHKRIANHEDLLLTDLAEVEQNVLDSPDSFAAWTEEIKHLHELPPTEVKPEDERNHEALARIIDRPPTLLSCEAAREVAPQNQRVRMEETRLILGELGSLAETKPQYNTDYKNDRAYHELKRVMANMGQTDDALVLANYRANHGGGADQVLQKWEGRKARLVKQASDLLADNPDQSLFFITQGEAYEGNLNAYHTVPKDGKETPWDQVSTKLADAQGAARTVANHPHVPDASLEAAELRIGARDAGTKYQEMRSDVATSRVLHENYQEILDELPLDFEQGALHVADFQKDFEAKNGRKIEDAVTALKEGVAFKELLEAVTEDDRAKAEQPLWCDMVYTERALRELNQALTDMKDAGMSTAHSGYRAFYEKAKEIELAHVQTWQRWQSLRVDRAAYAHPATPDFKGRIPAVMYLKDGDKGMYLIPPRGEGTTIVYPDNSTRSITVDFTTGVATTHDRVNLDGSEWKPRPVELEYQDAAPITSTMTSMGRVSLGMYNSLAANEKRVDNRDIATLVGQLPEMEYDWRMRPGDPNAVQAYYRFNRLIDQRATESIAEIRGDGTTPLTDAQEQRIANLRVVRTQAEYRAHYLQHGSEGDDSTMNRDGAVTFQGALHNEQGNWTILPSGFAWKEEITRKPDGSREVGHVLYSPDGSVYDED
jgi:hypothetical protein